MTYQIYVASLSDYNAGILHGKWIELEGKTTDEIQKEIEQILAESPLRQEIRRAGRRMGNS
jgi:UDP:flavonoid glycosyltransferase YjiC (YdhE family)